MKRAIVGILGLVSLISNAHAANYKIDPDHSTVGFKVKHLAISTVPGRFTDLKGTFSFDPEKISESKAEATIASKSISTENQKRDDHLRSAEFLDADKAPEITFKTTSVKAESKDKFKANGELTIRGVTKPVVLDVEFGGAAKDPWGNERAAFTATTKINRQDFGVSYSKALEAGGLVVGNEVDITIQIEGIKEKA